MPNKITNYTFAENCQSRSFCNPLSKKNRLQRLLLTLRTQTRENAKELIYRVGDRAIIRRQIYGLGHNSQSCHRWWDRISFPRLHNQRKNKRKVIYFVSQNGFDNLIAIVWVIVIKNALILFGSICSCHYDITRYRLFRMSNNSQ